MSITDQFLDNSRFYNPLQQKNKWREQNDSIPQPILEEGTMRENDNRYKPLIWFSTFSSD